ncbi:uncharacterized protein Dana_GF14483 [Drosophila ananassae]|uniref:Uncharacterized protein n=1 Tax=Drosophila ananassae TaxID=7217 RepID=B3MKM0_DROAN|nr:uncharacterized protein LOC6497307 [Drosophila ananassae]EDV31573.1 uncharacterized protein Dana_GF14483 [Drosophila ananassae]
MDQKGEAKQDRRSDSKMEEPHLSLRLKEHYEKEAEILRLLLNLENRFREYYKIFICEMKAQRILIERIWLLTQRYLILISSEQGCRYPEVYTLSTEEAIVNEYEEKLEVIRASNNKLKKAVLKILVECKEFYDVYDSLDKTQSTPFILGDKSHRSIQYHKIMVVDIFNYFHAMVLKLKCYMHQLDPVNLESVEDYREMLQNEAMCEEFDEYLNVRFVYCNCLLPRQTCPILKLKCSHQNIKNLKYVSRI